MDVKGDVLASHRGPRTVADFAGTIGLARKVLELRPKAEAGDRAARVEILTLLLEGPSVGVAEAERRLREIGDPGEDPSRLLAGVARLRLREKANELTTVRLQKGAILVLRFWPDDEPARAQAAYNSMLLKEHREALRHIGEGLRRFPGNVLFVRMAVDFHFQRGYSPVAFEYLKAGLKFPDKDGADFSAYSEKMAKAYQPSGGDAWEPAPLSTPVAGCETTVYRAAGKSRDPNVPWDEHVVVCRKDGLTDHAFRHFHTKEVSQLCS
jgi:hypothetical protein